MNEFSKRHNYQVLCLEQRNNMRKIDAENWGVAYIRYILYEYSSNLFIRSEFQMKGNKIDEYLKDIGRCL